MSSRSLVRSLTLSTALLSCALAAAGERPNFLLILADDMRADSIGALGNPAIKTPNLDRLVARGFAFTNAYCLGGNSPAVCTPSRNMLLSGRSFFRWGGSPMAPGGPPNFPLSMKAAGYATYHNGKRGNTAVHIQASFDTNIVLKDDEADRRSGEPGKAQVDGAIEFLRAHVSKPQAPPFFMYLAPAVPHDPRVAAKVYRDQYERDRIPLPKNFLAQHPFDNGEMAVRDEKLLPWPRTEAAVRETLHDLYATVTGFDFHLGRLFAALDELKLTANTIVILSADQGISTGSHGLLGKQNLYDHAMKVPLVFAGPGIPRGRSNALVYLFDIYPTVCELTGAPVPAGLDGVSFKPVLTGAAPSTRPELLLAYRDVQRAWRDERWKLIRYPQVDTTQLFDLAADPDEVRDLAGRPEHAGRVKECLGRLERLQPQFGDTLPLSVPHPRPAAWAPPPPAEKRSIAGRRPNIVFVLTDDQGYSDISAHGHPILKTPHLDRLHAEGVRFTDFHVSPTCSPTRSALLTGRHEFRNGVTHTILERERLALDAVTLAEVLRSAGYATGIFGKWHLGDEPEYRPERRGFDEVFIHGGGGIGQTYPGSCGDAPGNTYFDPAVLHNGRFVRTRGYCTDVFFSQAIAWMDAVKGQRPFFAAITCNAPHAPLQVRPEDEARYAGKVADPSAAKFFGMIANIDDNVGRLLARLAEWGIERETLVVFMNDNGTDAGAAVYNAGMRGKKGTAFLGGTRAASFWRWPGTLRPADSGALAAHIDFFPTLAAIAGAKLSDKVQAQVEGRSLVPLLEDPAAPWPERVLFTHLGRWPKGVDPNTAKFRTCAVRTPRWHLVSPGGAGAPRWLLFDVQADPGETQDLGAQHPDVVKRLASAYDVWWDSVVPGLVNETAVGPSVNPFKELFWKQLGGGPSEEDLRLMDPSQNPATAPQGRRRL